jgi:hypothetical protein
MCFPLLRMALISLVSVIGFFSGCGTPYGTMGGFSEIQLAPDIYRVSFSPYGYIPWDLAYQAGLPHCAALAIQNGYRYFGVLTIKNYGSGNSFSLPRNSYTYRTSNGRRNRDFGGSIWSSLCWCCHRAHRPAQISGGAARDPMRQTKASSAIGWLEFPCLGQCPLRGTVERGSDARVPPDTGNDLTEAEFL